MTEHMVPRPTWRCHIGRHAWEGTPEHRRCTSCLKVQLRLDGKGKWITKRQFNMAWCECGNELVGCPVTGCAPIAGGASRVMYACGRCDRAPIFDYGLAPVAIKVADDD